MQTTKRLGCISILLVLAALLPLACSKNDAGTNPMSNIITVTGRVVNATGGPLPNYAIAINGTQIAATDANGLFTVSNVTIPYTLAAANPGGTQAVLYVGLTRPDPTIFMLYAPSSTAASASFSGTASGVPGFPLPANHKASAIAIAGSQYGNSDINTSNGAFTTGVYWYNSPTTTVNLVALAWQSDPSTFLPTSYKGYGVKEGVVVSSGGVYAGQNIAMNPVGSVACSGTITVPAGSVTSTRTAWLLIEGGRVNPVSEVVSSGAGSAMPFSYIVPNIPGGQIGLEVYSYKQGELTVTGYKNNIPNNATGMNYVVPSGLAYVAPVSGATGVTAATNFSWSTSLPQPLFFTRFNGGGKTLWVVTTSLTTRIPDLANLGIGIAKNTSMNWSIEGWGPVANIDSAASPSWIPGFLAKSLPGEFYDAVMTTTPGFAERTFTTAP